MYADAEFESRVMTTKNILDTYLGLPVIGTLSIIGVWGLHKLMTAGVLLVADGLDVLAAFLG